MSNKRGRKPKLKPQHLKEHGYIFKIDVLTDEERDWQLNGVPVQGKPNVRNPPPDYLYYFKKVEGVEVRIYIAGGDLFYAGVKLKSIEQLPLIEQKAKDDAKWAHLQSQVEDTAPLQITETFKPDTPKAGTIELKGGPLDGQFVTWNNGLPFYLAQYQVPQLKAEHSGTYPPTKPAVMAARYKRSKENASIYEFDQNFM